jgi:steroid delta-isomerase-like uncharacterized protein
MRQSATGRIAKRISWEYPLACAAPQSLRMPLLREAANLHASKFAYAKEVHIMPMDSKAIVRRLYEDVWNKRKLELVSDIISPSHALHDNNFPGSSVGPEAYRAQMATYLAAFPDLRFTVEDIVAEKDKVAASWTISGTHKGEIWGVRPTNKKMSLDGITIHHIANGKIIDSYISSDALGLMRQLGIVPASPQPKGAAAR